MKIVLLEAYGMSKAGDVLPNVNKPVAEQLIRRKIAKRFKKAKK